MIILQKHTRYYKIFICKTLFQNYEVERIYGNINYKSCTGNRRNFFDNLENAQDFINKTLREKIKRGYEIKKLLK